MIIGQIESYNIEKQTGIVKSQDDFFEFDATSWKSSVPPDQGDEVTFNVNDGVVSNMLLVAETMKPVEAVKRRWIATLLALFLGFAGVHRFYLGFYKLGLAQIALTALTQGYGVLWGFIDAVLLFAGHINKDAKNRPLK
ncbi:MAG: TM2 domain-containing protein [Methylococcaceae bacterium]|jgi:TM2 domain-containing membrane protein YozV